MMSFQMLPENQMTYEKHHLDKSELSLTRWVRKRQAVRTIKPINSWIGFRTFYRTIFPGMQQKEASVHLRELWEQDPFKAKWSIISAAYSKIRDTITKERAPLAKFLKIVCPHIGILSVEDYLLFLNWISFIDENGIVKFEQYPVPNLSQLPDKILSISMTGSDVIQICAEQGFIQQEVADQINRTSEFVAFRGGLNHQGLLALPPKLSQKTQVRTYGPEEITQDGFPAQINLADPVSEKLKRDCTIELNINNTKRDFSFEHFPHEEFLNIDLPSTTSNSFCESSQGCLFNNKEDGLSLEGYYTNYEHLLLDGNSEYDIPGFSYQLFLENPS